MPCLLTIVGGKAIHFRATDDKSEVVSHLGPVGKYFQPRTHKGVFTVEDSVLEVGFIGSSAPSSDAMPS